MRTGLALRACAYLTFAIGLLMRLGIYPMGRGARHLHLSLAVAVLVLAPLAISAAPGPRQALRRVARWFPAAPFVLGLGFFLGFVPMALVDLHALLGIAAIALFDISLAAQRRAAAGAR